MHIAFPLRSNGYLLSDAANRLGALEPSDPAEEMNALRERFRAQGVLWLKGLLDRKSVLAFRRRYFEAMQDTGLLAAGSDPVDGIFSGAAEQRGKTNTYEVVRWAAYEAFCLSEPIWRFYEAFLDGAVYLHKRKIIRLGKPGQTRCTGAHYDLTYLRGGTDHLCTSWIPIGDCTVAMGGLIYLEGSDAFGRVKEAEFSQLNAHLPPEARMSAYNENMSRSGWLTEDLPALADRLDTRWLTANYEAGDMVVHSPYMIHASTENVSPDQRMRLSTDIRYQLVSERIDPRWAKDWTPDDGL
ncbi:MAG: phytanoyl-CoA dioxygenase family protein [Anaerolineae bacterium]|nr:phytanoyl-CoA dioxygenase family protein [Anaerolineae bacterium]